MTREKKFRKKPVVVEAFQFTDESKDAAYRWASSHQMNIDPSFDDHEAPILLIPTPEGEMICRIGDWIIRGVNGEFYPCKPDIFEKTYEPATHSPSSATAEEMKQAICDEIQKSLNGAKLKYIFTDDEDIMPLVDFLSTGDTIAEGQEEIENLVEQIYFDMDSWPSFAALAIAEATKELLKQRDELREDRDRGLLTLRNCRETIEMLQGEIPGEQLLLRHEITSRLKDIDAAIKSTEG